ncbi:MAG: flagellar motor switch protein FliN [Firmicutes bacterium]|nr:flagellar motor switch protein FliN [Bacillota bacterium]
MGGVIKGTGMPGDRELKALGEMMGRVLSATTDALGTLLGRKVSFEAGGATVVKQGPVLDKQGERVLAAIALNGEAEGNAVLSCAAASAVVLIDLMMGGDGSGADQALKPEEIDALGELVNQATGAAMTGLGALYGIQCKHSVQRVFTVAPDSVDAFNQRLDYPVINLSWTMQIGESLAVEFDQIVERRLITALLDALNEKGDARDAKPAAPKAAPAVALEQAPAAGVSDAALLISRQSGISGDGNGAGAQTGPVPVRMHQFPELEGAGVSQEPRKIDMLLDVPLNLTVELGRTRRLVKDILQLGPGSVIELDKLAGEAVDVLVNGRLLAKAEVVVIDENFGVRITEIVGRTDRLKDLRQ